MQYWIIRNPYRHQTWNDIIYKDQFRLYGIRGNYAQKQIASMQIGDKAIFYDGKQKAFMGILEVIKEPYQDWTSDNSKYKAVDFKPIQTFNNLIKPENLKECLIFQNSLFIKQKRFSTYQIIKELYNKITQGTVNNE